jgi:hypothetical protein
VDRNELAWAAGFFDGEGWASAVRQQGRGTTQPQARVNQADPAGVPEVLERLQVALGGLGRIGGPYVDEGRIDLYSWTVSSRPDVEQLHHLMLPWLCGVKLREFAVALGRPAARSRMAGRGDDWRAWAAGLYDGEGSTYLTNHRTHAGYRNAEARVTQSAPGATPEVLSRFQEIVGCGRIYGPYVQDVAHQLVFRWNASAFGDIDAMLTLIWPWLGAVKRAQATAVRDVMRAQPQLPRGRPEWGNRKTHCIRGHEYATSRIRPYVPRGKGEAPRDSHQCLVCAREQAKTRRQQKRRSAADDDRRSISEAGSRYLLK